MKSLHEYKKDAEEKEFMKAVAAELMETYMENELELNDVKKKLDIE